MLQTTVIKWNITKGKANDGLGTKKKKNTENSCSISQSHKIPLRGFVTHMHCPPRICPLGREGCSHSGCQFGRQDLCRGCLLGEGTSGGIMSWGRGTGPAERFEMFAGVWLPFSITTSLLGCYLLFFFPPQTGKKDIQNW